MVDKVQSKDLRQLHAAGDNLALKNVSREEQERRRQDGYWLNDVDVIGVAQKMGLSRDRFVAFPIIHGNNGSIAQHLAFRKEDLAQAKIKSNQPFYMALSVANAVGSQGCHWMPVKCAIDAQGKLDMTIELSQHASAADKQTRQGQLEQAAKAAGFTNYTVIAEATSKQSDGWTCGYRTLSRIAHWENTNPVSAALKASANAEANVRLKAMADIQADADKPNANQNDISVRLNGQVFEVLTGIKNTVKVNTPKQQSTEPQNAQSSVQSLPKKMDAQMLQQIIQAQKEMEEACKKNIQPKTAASEPAHAQQTTASNFFKPAATAQSQPEPKQRTEEEIKKQIDDDYQLALELAAEELKSPSWKP